MLELMGPFSQSGCIEPSPQSLPRPIAGDIPADAKPRRHRICSEIHPGICASGDSAIDHALLRIVIGLHAVHNAEDTWFLVQCYTVEEEAPVVGLYAHMPIITGKPRMNFYIGCDVVDGDGEQRLRLGMTGEGLLDCYTASTIAHRLTAASLRAGQHVRVETAEVVVAPIPGNLLEVAVEEQRALHMVSAGARRRGKTGAKEAPDCTRACRTGRNCLCVACV